MTGAAALITAIAALVGALVWPAAILTLLIFYRSHVRAAIDNIPSLVRRMRKVKMGAFEAELADRADDLVDEAVADPGAISARQIRSAARITIAAKSLPGDALRDQLQQLGIEYETIRKAMPPGVDRTRAMLNVLVRMRTLAPAVAGYVDELKASPSRGARLAAIAIMQVDPACADLAWLRERFRVDDPFTFFQAATVLRALLNRDAATNMEIVAIAREALAIVRSYEGEPDADTIDILESLAAGRSG